MHNKVLLMVVCARYNTVCTRRAACVAKVIRTMGGWYPTRSFSRTTRPPKRPTRFRSHCDRCHSRIYSRLFIKRDSYDPRRVSIALKTAFHNADTYYTESLLVLSHENVFCTIQYDWERFTAANEYNIYHG
jgi:hypothetical protein